MPPSVRWIKRALDICASLVGLAVSAPLCAIIAAAIKIEGPGPVFYEQRRAGVLKGMRKDGTTDVPEFAEFTMRKFRSMRVDAERGGPVLAEENDPRVTKVGRVLRKTRLDELPQFWNVLTGQMSLVGPRPERPELAVDLAMAIPYFEERMRDVKPGITGLAQVSLGYTGRPPEGSDVAEIEGLDNVFDFEEAKGAIADDMKMKLLYDLAYAAHLESLSTYLEVELEVIWKTPMVMLGGLGKKALGR